MKKKAIKNKKAATAKKKIVAKVAKKKAAKKSVKKAVKPKAQKKKKPTPVNAKKIVVKKSATKKAIKKVAKIKVQAKTSNKKLPGYPHYAAKDDIMNKANKMKKINLAEEVKGQASKKKSSDNLDELDERPFLSEIKDKKQRNSGKLTKEDQDMLGEDELNSDMGDDAVLKNRVWPIDMSGDDLDIPGAELDDANEIIGEEDEENNNYSIGGDRHEDLDENTDPGM